VLRSEDTQVMLDAMQTLGVAIEQRDNETVAVTGSGGDLAATTADLDVANSGTTMRFLTAVLTLGKGTYRLHGTPRMCQRPIQDLIDALRPLGGQVRSERGTGCPPVLVSGGGLAGGTTHVRGDVSSQFLSGLLMVAPYARQDVELRVAGQLVSVPYVTMTGRVMEAFGVSVQWQGDADAARIRVPAGRGYVACDYQVEPDASAASYFFALAAITGGQVTVEGLSIESIQGDVRFVTLLEAMGCSVDYGHDRMTVRGSALCGITADMNAISDTVQTLAAVALFAKGPTTIEHVAHIRHKETDRIGNLAVELRKFGARVLERADGLTIDPAPLHGATIATYDDHRMAMSLALVGLRVPGVRIEDPENTAKTYPQFFTDLNAAIGR